jgi:hypothetical protein
VRDGVVCCAPYRLECGLCYEADQALYDAIWFCTLLYRVREL